MSLLGHRLDLGAVALQGAGGDPVVVVGQDCAPIDNQGLVVFECFLQSIQFVDDIGAHRVQPSQTGSFSSRTSSSIISPVTVKMTRSQMLTTRSAVRSRR